MGVATVCFFPFFLFGYWDPGAVAVTNGFACLGLARMRTRKFKGKEKEEKEKEGEPGAGEDRAATRTGAIEKKDDADIDEDQDEDGGVRITEKVTGSAEKAGDNNTTAAAAAAAAAAEAKQGKKKKKTSVCQFHPGRVMNKVLFLRLLLINLRCLGLCRCVC